MPETRVLVSRTTRTSGAPRDAFLACRRDFGGDFFVGQRRQVGRIELRQGFDQSFAGGSTAFADREELDEILHFRKPLLRQAFELADQGWGNGGHE